MIPFRAPSGQVPLFLTLFANVALSALQNVTVDDAVLTGAVVPQYSPDSVWSQGNNCTTCSVKPDPLQAFKGTWHDTTYIPGNGYTQKINFTFTGSALYIFFILANTATTSNGVEFVLDQVTVGKLAHTPTTSADFEYNVPVYVNESLVLGQHQMLIQPANSGNNVLMLFDYLIYTTSTSSPASSSGTATSSPSPSTLPSSSPSPSKPGAGASSTNVGAIVGGTVGGVVALVVVAVSLLCYRKHHNGRNGDQTSAEEGAIMDPFVLSREVASRSLAGTTSSTLPVAEVAPRGKAGVWSVTAAAMPPPPNLPASTTTSVTLSGGSALSSGNRELIEQVVMLRDEVVRLRNLQDSNRNTVVHSEAPPEYSG